MKTERLIVTYIVRFLIAIILGAAWALVAYADNSAAPIPLTLESSITRAIQTQLTTKLAKASTLEARGRVIQSAASLLPQVTGSVSQSRTFKTNLAAIGFEASPFLPNPVIGPYNTFDARFELVQKILDLNAIWNTKAASANERAAKLAEDLAAEQIASAASLAYIEDLRSVRNVEAAEANLALANRLSELAHHQHDAGVATGIDVARADTSVAQNHQALIQAKLAATQADVRLKRVVGIPLAETVALSSPAATPSPSSPVASDVPFLSPSRTGQSPVGDGGSMDSRPATAGNDGAKTSPDDVINKAISDRVELRIVGEQVNAERYALDAARANHLPTITANADYGFSGNTPDSTARTGSIGGQLNLPIFSGGATHGQVVEAQGRLMAAKDQAADAHIQVEEDVRLALQTLSAERDEVSTANTQVSLAERELKLAEDRYRTGVGDNIQVVTAQTSVSDARRSLVDATARYSDAEANLASAIGHMRTFHL